MDPGFFNTLIKIQRRFLSYTENQRCLLKSVGGRFSDYGESFGRKNFLSVDYPSFLFKSALTICLYSTIVYLLALGVKIVHRHPNPATQHVYMAYIGYTQTI